MEPANKPIWVMPAGLEEALKLADIIAKSTLCPNNYKNKSGDVFVAAKFGEALGLSIMQSIVGIAVINGRPGIYGDDMLAVVQSHPAYEWHREFWENDGKGDALVAVCQVKRRGQEVHESRFSVADAKRAGLWDDRARIPRRDGGGDMANPAPWHCYPKRMLMFRARGFALRDKFADALRGMRTVEELQDYPPQTIEGSFSGSPFAEEDRQQQSAGESSSGSSGEQGTEPAEPESVKQEFASSWHSEAKVNHTAKDMRSYLKDTLGVATSLEIPKDKREQAMTWAKTKGDAQPAANGKAEEKKADPQQATQVQPTPYDQAFDVLGWDQTKRQDYLKKMEKFSEAQIKADLNRIIDEPSAGPGK